MSDTEDPLIRDFEDAESLAEENARLRAELEEAQETLRAIRKGEVDAIVVAGDQGEQVYSLSGAESVYRLIVQTMQEAALTLTPDGTILSCNPQAEALVRTPTGALLGRPLADFLMPEARAAFSAFLTRSQTIPVQQRLVFRTSDGAGVPAHVAAHAIPQPDGPCICLVATDLSQLETSLETLRQIREQQAALEEQAQQLRDSAGTLERRVQERTIRLAAQADQLRALAAELTRAEQRERRRLADALHDEHQQLLVAARLRAITLGRTADPAVQEASQEITEILQEAIEHARVLTRDLSPPFLQRGGLVPALTWLADRMRDRHKLAVHAQIEAAAVPASEEVTILVYQAVRELFLNVVKHAQVDAARLTVTRENSQVRIEVADAGVGFDPQQLSAEGRPTGGFGLSNIQQRLTLFGGRLEIASAPGQGSRFTLWAPLQVPPVPLTAAIPPASLPLLVEPAAPPGAGQTLRVLLADDHAIVRQTLARLLNVEPDFAVVGEASDGGEAVSLVRQLQPDIVLMDVNLPDMNGIQATRAIHAECPRVRVIGLSMYEDAEHANAMRAAGAVAYLQKTAPVETLLAVMRGHF